jgi:hypothetical protein
VLAREIGDAGRIDFDDLADFELAASLDERDDDLAPPTHPDYRYVEHCEFFRKKI